MGLPDDELVLQRQARAIGDPTRYRLFRTISDAGRPMRVNELVAVVGLHHSAVRQHLGELRDAGLLVESTEHSNGPGRPHLLYRTSVQGSTRWAGPAPYEQLSTMLLEMLNDGTPPRDVGRAAGRAAGARVAPADPTAEVAVVRELSRLGFDPSCVEDEAGVDVVLRHCPMETAASRCPDIVCVLHHGVVEGIASAVGAGEVTGFSADDARRAGCRFRLNATGAATGGSGVAPRSAMPSAPTA